MPAYLLRTLRASAAAPQHATPAGLLLLAAHAAMLETGFVPAWAFAAADEAEAGEGENRGASASASGAASPYAIPASAWASAGIARIHYRLAPDSSDTNGAGSGVHGSGGGAEGMEVEPADGEGTGAAASGDGGATQAPACTLHCSSLGGFGVVLAVSSQAHTRHLALQAAAFVRPRAGQASGPSSSEALAGPSSGGGSSSSASAPPPAQVEDAVQLLPGGGLAVGGLSLEGGAVRELWRRLRDGLALPMLLAAYAGEWSVAFMPPRASFIVHTAGISVGCEEQREQRAARHGNPTDLCRCARSACRSVQRPGWSRPLGCWRCRGI